MLIFSSNSGGNQPIIFKYLTFSLFHEPWTVARLLGFHLYLNNVWLRSKNFPSKKHKLHKNIKKKTLKSVLFSCIFISETLLKINVTNILLICCLYNLPTLFQQCRKQTTLQSDIYSWVKGLISVSLNPPPPQIPKEFNIYVCSQVD